MGAIEFTGNYDDLSTDKGYQFKFYCQKCGNGYMSTFETSTMGMATSAIEAAGRMFGGLFSRAASSAYEVQRAVGGPAHDAALKRAVEEIRPLFRQCTRCGRWICEPVCFNKKQGLCEDCAPDLAQEIAAAQAEAAREQIQQKAREHDWLAGVDIAAPAALTCPSCGAAATGAKFCPECGAAIAAKRKCRACGTEAPAAAKFCPDCGSRF